MDEENKKEAETKDSQPESLGGKLDYSIRSMGSDLKKEASKAETFDIHPPQEEKGLGQKKEKEKQPEPEKPKEESISPFLNELGDKKTAEPERKISPQPEKTETKEPEPKAEPQPEETKEKFSPIAKVDPSQIGIKDPLKENTQKPVPKEKPSTNKGLVLILAITSAMAIGAGFYYFYWMNNAPAPEDPTPVVPETTQEIEPEIEIEPETKTLPTALNESSSLQISEESLETLILAQKDSLVEGQNYYYKLKNSEQVSLASSDLISALQIQLPQEVQQKLDQNWIFLHLQGDVLKMGLVFELQNNSSEEISTFLESNEYRLPELMKGLFVDELFVLDEQVITFSDSGLAQGVRYYNFIKEDNTKSLDWGIGDEKYLFFGTSQKTTLKLVEDLEK